MQLLNLNVDTKVFVSRLITSLHLLLLLGLIMPNAAKCQSSYQDSLRKVIATSPTNQKKLDALILLGLDRNSLHADSLSLYATQAGELAIKLNNKEAFMETLLMQGSVWIKKGNSAKAIELADKEIKASYTQPALRHKQRKFYLLKGFVLNVINKPREAQETYFNVLAKAETEEDFYVQAVALNGIGWSFHNLQNTSKAIEWYKKGLSCLQKLNLSIRTNKDLLTVLQSNIGLAYYPLFKKSGNKAFADSANLYLDSAIQMSRHEDFWGVLAISLGTKALLIKEKRTEDIKAISILQEAIGIRKKLGQLYFIISDMYKLSEMYYQTHDYNKSILTCSEAIRLADSSGIKSDIIELYETLARSYRANSQYKEYGDILAIQVRVQDSINKANAQASLNELTVKYEFQKKEALITKQEYSLFKRKILIYVIIIGAIIALLIALIRFWKFQKEQKRKIEAIKAEEKIKMQIENKLTRENERNRIMADLHDDIGATLSSMHIYGNLAKNVWSTKPDESKMMIDKISTTSKDLMNRMGDIIWSMKPGDEEKYSFKARLKNYCAELLAPKNILVSFDIDDNLAASINSPEVRKNILLIAKEAINNIAKYSEAGSATISFKKQQEAILLCINDNGKGFETAAAKKGNGLQNIQQRCKHLNGLCSIDTGIGQGTSIKCSFPVASISYSQATGK